MLLRAKQAQRLCHVKNQQYVKSSRSGWGNFEVFDPFIKMSF